MWYAGCSAGLPHPVALTAAGDFSRSRVVGTLHKHLLEGTRRRESLAALTRVRPDLLAPFEAALIELGEETGRLEEIFKLLGDYFQAEYRMVLSIKRKMSYPMINALAAIFIAPFPILFFGNSALYLLTVAGGLVMAVSLGGTLLRSVARWYGGKREFVLARLCRALALAVEAGLPLDRVVDLGVKAADDPRLAAHVKGMTVRERGTQTLASTLGGPGILPHEVLAALRVADETGNYRDTMKRLATLYDGDYGR